LARFQRLSWRSRWSASACRERSFKIDQSRTSMIAGRLCTLRSTVFSETFCYVACASDVDGAIRAGEDVNERIPPDGRRRFSRWDLGKIISLGHGRWVPLKPITKSIRRAVACSGHSTIRRAVACSGHSTRFLVARSDYSPCFCRMACHEQATARRMATAHGFEP
jgi:hypothetical protein